MKPLKTMRQSIVCIAHFLVVQICIAQNGNCDYLSQNPPGDSAEIFPHDIVARPDYFASERIAISPDKREIYYTERNGYSKGARSRIKCFRFYGNKWNGPFTLFDYNCPLARLSPDDYITSPGLSPDGKMLYFHDSRHQTYFAVRNDSGWSEPSVFWNNSLFKHYLQLTRSGNYYLTSNPDGSMSGLGLCKLEVNDADTTIRFLNLPLNSERDVIDFYISRDESYLIFSSEPKQKRTCFGYVDLFITYKKSDGNWTNPKNLGRSINAASLANWGPYVTDDSKYLFFSRGVSDATTSLYWVKLGNLIDSLKHTNFAPYVNLPLPEKSATIGTPFNYSVSDSAFADDDGNNTLRLSATLGNGNVLPAWLKFDSETRTFSGLPTDAGEFVIRVKAVDANDASVSSEFTLFVSDKKQ